MLYQTQHPHFFQFHAFTSIPPPPPPASASDSNTNPNSLSSSTPVQVQEMEGALKSSLMKEMDMKSSPQEGSDDLWPVNAQNGASCDDDFVNEFFDFSNDEGFVEPQQEQEQEEERDKNRTLSVPVKQEQEFDLNQDINYNDFGPIPAEELAVPTVDVENLEWLSHFVEDSFSEYSSPIPAGNLLVKPKKNVSEPEAIPVVGTPCFKTPVPAKARSKRARTGGRVWSLDSPSLSDSSTSSTSSPYSSSPPSPLLIYTDRSSISILEPIEKGRKQKKKSMTEMVSVTAGRSEGLVTRRCSHCGVVKTPQWRAGPLGAKTLCNACGVRYKSGRLLPEYRPACSPTFSSELHSNHHRKVLEMRRKKELLGRAEPGLAPPAPVVRSF